MNAHLLNPVPVWTPDKDPAEHEANAVLRGRFPVIGNWEGLVSLDTRRIMGPSFPFSFVTTRRTLIESKGRVEA